MKPTKTNLMRLARKLDLDVGIESAETENFKKEVTVMAPPFHHFAGDDVHERVIADGSMAELYALAIEEIEGGFERCTAETCQSWGNHADHDDCCEWWGPAE